VRAAPLPRAVLAAGVALLAGVALGPRGAAAHPMNASAFDAFTTGKDVRVDFRLEAASAVGVLNRSGTPGAPFLAGTIEGHADVLLAYVAARFSVRNDDDACAPEPPGQVLLHPQTSKVLFTVTYRCAGDLDVLTVRSTLFDEEQAPHPIILTLHHQRALERYFLSRSVPEAVIPLPRLAQVLPMADDGSRQFHMATPPPGAFAGRAKVAVGVPVARASAGPGGGFLGLFRGFFGQGILHILGGLDHVLFVISLLIVVRGWRQLAAVVTSFTVAHSLTLGLGALGLVTLPPRFVEPVIALSILYVAVENVVRATPRARLGVTFAFGLVHGFGFSGVLRDLGLPAGQVVPALLGFNLGVETGQLLIVAPLFPLVVWAQGRARLFPRVRVGVNASVALIACWWFAQRAFGVPG
jgi:hypothetical protein